MPSTQRMPMIVTRRRSMTTTRRIARWLVACAVLVAASHGGQALASGVVILSDQRAEPYREALASARAVLQDAAVVDVSRPNLEPLLQRARPSVVLAIGRSALMLSLRALPETPIVHCLVLGAPSAPNVTGVRFEPAAALHLARFVEIDPAARRIGVVYDPAVSAPLLEEARRVAATLQVTLVARPIVRPEQLRPVLDELAPVVQAFWLMPSPRLVARDQVEALMAYSFNRRRPVFGFLDNLTRQGALASVSTDYKDAGREAAALVQRILARASTSAPLPSPVAAPARVTINLTTAERFGIAVPGRALSTAHRLFR